MKYVGETGQQFHTRKQQHQRDVKNRASTNGIYNHLKHNKKHKISWVDAVFIVTWSSTVSKTRVSM